MKCEAVQAVLSEAMDGPAGAEGEAAEHAASCWRCRSFRRGAWRVRELVRFEVAPTVPDLAPAIMAAVREESAGGGSRPLRAPGATRAVALALAAGLVVGFALTGGGLVSVRRANPSALASEIPHRLLGAASALSGYRATFDIVELNWTQAVPRRTFRADLAFRGPEDFAVRVRDSTRYPSSSWPRNDMRLVTNGRRWKTVGPDPCPRPMLPACPAQGNMARSVIGRAPFDPQTEMPTDVILPMTTLAASDRVDVTGAGLAAGRPVIRVELAYQDAVPLFGYLHFAGSWRPFFPLDQVVLSLDERTWFPVRYQVFPAPGPLRAAWATQRGLPPEPADKAVFTATARSLRLSAPDPALFAVRPGSNPVDEGFRDRPPHTPDPAMAFGPQATDGLTLVRAGTFEPSASRPFRESVLAYSRGLAWATVTEARRWRRRSAFGVGPFAEPVTLPRNKGVAYYEPATGSDPRRLTLHTARGEYLVVTNLPRDALLRLAGSMPVTGLPQPTSWLRHRWPGGEVEGGFTVSRAVSLAGFQVLVPSSLPPGYRPASAELLRSLSGPGMIIDYRRPAAQLDGTGLLLTEVQGQGLPPPIDPAEVAIALRGTLARWSADQHRLEWLEGGTYLSLTAPGLELGDLVRVAASLGSP